MVRVSQVGVGNSSKSMFNVDVDLVESVLSPGHKVHICVNLEVLSSVWPGLNRQRVQAWVLHWTHRLIQCRQCVLCDFMGWNARSCDVDGSEFPGMQNGQDFSVRNSASSEMVTWDHYSIFVPVVIDQNTYTISPRFTAQSMASVRPETLLVRPP